MVVDEVDSKPDCLGSNRDPTTVIGLVCDSGKFL